MLLLLLGLSLSLVSTGGVRHGAREADCARAKGELDTLERYNCRVGYYAVAFPWRVLESLFPVVLVICDAHGGWWLEASIIF